MTCALALPTLWRSGGDPALTSVAPVVQKSPELRQTPRYAVREHRITGSVIDSSTSLLQRADGHLVSFATGSTPADALPAHVMRELSSVVLAEAGAAALNYGPTEGERDLRAALLELLAAKHELVDEDELLITSGGMQGLDLACKLFVDPDDLVVVESPTYTNALATIASYEGTFLEVPVDAEGLRVDLLPGLVRRAGRTPRLVHVIPNNQNPTGVTLSLERRIALLSFADEWDALVLEDDPYAWLRFDGEQLPSLYGLDTAGRVVAVNTFSKILAPGLRVGWMLAPPPVIGRMRAAKQGMDTCTNVLGQRLIAEFLRRGLMEAHLDHLRRDYREKKETMDAALVASFGDLASVTWTDPAGGVFLWLQLSPEVDADRLARTALEHGVAVIAGTAFSSGAEFAHAVRLCFSSPHRTEIHEGVRRLRAAFDQLYDPPGDR